MPEAPKVSLEELLTQAAGGTPPATPPVDPVPPVTPPADPVPPTTPADPVPPVAPTVPADPVDPAANPADPVPPVDPVPPKDKPNPVKELREKYNTEKTAREKIDATIQRLTDGTYDLKLKDFKNEAGKVDYDALAKAMDAADTKVKAEQKGIPPEVQAEVERIEREKIELNKQKLQVSMDRALNELQLDLGIKQPEINNFFKDSMAVKKNPYQWIAQGGTLKDLYRIIYWDKLVDSKSTAAVAAAKAQWEADAQRSQRAPVANPAPTKPQAGVKPDGLSLEAMLTEAAAKANK